MCRLPCLALDVHSLAGACIFALRPQDQQLCLLLVRESKRVKRLGVKAGQAVTAEGAAAPEGRELVACWNLMGEQRAVMGEQLACP